MIHIACEINDRTSNSMKDIELVQTIQSNEALESSVVGNGGVSPGLFSPVLPPSPLLGVVVVVGTLGLFIPVVGVAIPPAVLEIS
ncbi:hypothetical protein PTKIN_Ptkin17bG0053600 [Pterospermum kingtungense]